MGKSSAFNNDLLKFIFNATPIANLADNAASSPLTQLFLALHTADPGVGGNQSTSEATYGAYARLGVARSAAGFTVSGSTVSLTAANNNFPTSTGSPNEVERYASVGKLTSGAGEIFYSGPITPNISVNNPGIQPSLTSASTITEA